MGLHLPIGAPINAFAVILLFTTLSAASETGIISDVDWPVSTSIHTGILAPRVTVENQGSERATFWAQYSIRDPEGKWYEGQSSSTTLDPGRTGTIYCGSISIDASMPRGAYKEVVVLGADSWIHEKLDLIEHEFEAD